MFLADLTAGDGSFGTFSYDYDPPSLSAGEMSGQAPQLADEPAPAIAMPFSPALDFSLVVAPDGYSVFAVQHGRKFHIPDPDTLTHTFQPLVQDGWNGPSVWTLLNKSAAAANLLYSLPERPWPEFQADRWIPQLEQALLPDGVGAPLAQSSGILPLSSGTIAPVLYAQKPATAEPVTSALVTTVARVDRVGPAVNPIGAIFGRLPAIVEPAPLAPLRETVAPAGAPRSLGALLLPLAAAAALAFL